MDDTTATSISESMNISIWNTLNVSASMMGRQEILRRRENSCTRKSWYDAGLRENLLCGRMECQDISGTEYQCLNGSRDGAQIPLQIPQYVIH